MDVEGLGLLDHLRDGLRGGSGDLVNELVNGFKILLWVDVIGDQGDIIFWMFTADGIHQRFTGRNVLLDQEGEELTKVLEGESSSLAKVKDCWHTAGHGDSGLFASQRWYVFETLLKVI